MEKQQIVSEAWSYDFLWWVIPLVVIIFIIIVVVFLLKASMVMVRQNHRIVIERFGKYLRTIDSEAANRIEFIIPFVDRISLGKAIFMGDRTLSLFPPDDRIEFRDGSAAIEVSLYWRVYDEKKFRYASQNPIGNMQQKMKKAVADFLGDHEMSAVNKDRSVVNLPSVVMEADLSFDDPSYLLHPLFLTILNWGIEVFGVDLIDIKMPEKYINAMDKVYEAKKDEELAVEQKKARVIRADTEKEEALIKAEGEKQAEIKRGQGRAIAKKEMVEKEGLATAAVLEDQLKRLATIVGKEQAVSLIVNNKKWGSVGSDTIIIDNHGSSDSDVARGAGFASGSEAVKGKLQVKKSKNQTKNQVGD